MGELLADAGEEEPRQAVAVDQRDARRRQPPDQPEPDHVQVPPQPVPWEPDRPTTQNKQSVSDTTIHPPMYV